MKKKPKKSTPMKASSGGDKCSTCSTGKCLWGTLLIALGLFCLVNGFGSQTEGSILGSIIWYFLGVGLVGWGKCTWWSQIRASCN